MERLLTYENFEVDENKTNNPKKVKKSHSFARINIVLTLIIIFQIIYLIRIFSTVKEKNNQLTRLNFKKYLLDNGNKKLDQELNEIFQEEYSFEEENKKKDKEIKIKEEQIKKYKKMSSNLLHNISPETLVKLKEENKDKKIKIDELKLILDNNSKIFREQFNTKIIDSKKEFNIIETLINKKNNKINDFKLCYIGQNEDINYGDAYDKCDFNKDTPFLILFQTNKFERYGIYLSNRIQNNSFVFSFPLNNKNFGKILESESFELNNYQRQSLIYLLNLVKNLNNDDNNNKDKDSKDNNNNIDEEKYFNITDLEIFHI